MEAEAELLAAITLFFERLGLSCKDIGIKVSSRKVGVEPSREVGVEPSYKVGGGCRALAMLLRYV